MPDDLNRGDFVVSDRDEHSDVVPRRGLPRRRAIPSRDFLRFPDRDKEPVHPVERVRPEEPRHLRETEAPSRETEKDREEEQSEAKQKKEPEEDPADAARRRRKRWIIAGIVIAVLLLAGAGFGYYWYSTLRWLESTDDAYTQADNTTVSPKVAGYVSELLVTDNQVVKAGETLLRIDPRDYKAAVDQAQADVQSAQANIQNIDAQIAMQQSVIDQARADIVAAQANVTFAAQQNARYQELARTGSGTVQAAQQAFATLRTNTATLQHNQATLDQAIKQVAVLRTQRGVAEATLQHNRAVLEQANLNLGYTTLTAPIDGAVGDRSVRVGQYVQAGAQLMTIVPMGGSIYVVANFKETQITKMFRGESVDLTVDTFPGVHLHGKVDSLSPGSGAQFALLPPENATGNFTKIVQRVPVKILIDDQQNPVLNQLRPGLSVIASVDLRTAPPEGTPTLVPARAGAH